ncbi:XRE family transcriptional regulator [Nitrosomonas nitrosa]|uniref:XRE family transcriptional regulator n=1 Tax=Nitrosomonas nitrosa TaxID=52442 RepID=A0A8H8YZC1_9PROT|nr:ImmA/IrrE family metallo-endopeptidase [Nitrosomonas nitrosa]CAE6505599.1 XRE family transcriptional regulator [Nitrosomonas nitrosa]
MSEPIPVNSEILRWARLSLHLTVDEVALRMKRDITEIEAWERGEAFPTYVQLETLAYDIYKRPLALFFFPTPPEEESIDRSFRTLPEYELERIPPRMRFLLRKARVLQLNLAELHEGVNPSRQQIIHDLHFESTVAAADMAERVRSYFDVTLEQQQNWKTIDDALKYWRETLEDKGVFVFKDSFNPPGRKRADIGGSPFSGFCLYDSEFPVIYVNNNKPKTRQIFTLFHELAHLLMHTGGVDTRVDDYIEYLTGDSKRIEVLCNQFSAEFLVPMRDFAVRSAGISVDDITISNLANFYYVSRETILRRLLDQGQVGQQYYEQKAQQWLEEREQGGEGSGNHYLTKGAYLGERYIEAVFSRYHKGRISVEQAADYLGEKTKNVPGMEDWLFKRGATA